MNTVKKLKTAIVYDWIDTWGGVERVLLTLGEQFPHADFYTSYFDAQEAVWAKKLRVRTSFMQSLPRFIKKNRALSFPFYPYAFEAFDFSSYDLVLSVSSSFAKAVITRPETLHISYLLTPTRYLWGSADIYLKHAFQKAAGKVYREWDWVAAQRPDHIISLSETVAERCRKFYGRASEVIYPPFDIEYWSTIKSKVKSQNAKLQFKNQKYFLLVSRLEPYKRVDLAIDAFNKTEGMLIIVGKGTHLERLKTRAKENIRFLSGVTDLELARLYRNAEALIVPQEEDFGYTVLEAQFFGCPVIAYEKGGTTETVLKNKAGIFFREQKEKSLTDAVARFRTMSYNLKKSASEWGKKNVEKFSRDTFEKQLASYINSKLK